MLFRSTSSSGSESETIEISLSDISEREVFYLHSPKPVSAISDNTKIIGEYKPPAQAGEMHTVGTFVGVFVPCFVNLLNIVFFARLPWCVGKFGGLETFLSLISSFVIVMVTMTSLSALSTNGEIESGGSYYLVARTIGPESGGSVGLCLATASILGGATAAIGLAEQIVIYYSPFTFTNKVWDVKIIAVICSTIIAYLSNYGFPVRFVSFFRDLIRACNLSHRSRLSGSYQIKGLHKMFQRSFLHKLVQGFFF